MLPNRWFLLAIALPACSARPPAPPGPRLGDHDLTQRTVVRVESHLSRPHRLAGAVTVVDGTPVIEARAPRGISTREARVPLETGVHVLQAVLDVRYPAMASGPDCALTLRSSHAMFTGPSRAAVTLHVHSKSILVPFEENVAVTYREVGTVVPRPHDDIWDRGSACEGGDPKVHSVCRAEAALARAREVGDVIWIQCIEEALRALRE